MHLVANCSSKKKNPRGHISHIKMYHVNIEIKNFLATLIFENRTANKTRRDELCVIQQDYRQKIIRTIKSRLFAG